MAKKEWIIKGPSEHCGYREFMNGEGDELCHWYRQVLVGDKFDKVLKERNITPDENGKVPCTYVNCPQRKGNEVELDG